MKAANDESLPASARLDPALNTGLKAAIRSALSVGIPAGEHSVRARLREARLQRN